MWTIVQIILGIIGCIFFFLLKPILGILFIQLSYLFDCVDGEIERYKEQESTVGKYLDTVGHFLIIPLFYFSFSYYLSKKYGLELLLIFGFLMSFSTLLRMSKIYRFFSLKNYRDDELNIVSGNSRKIIKLLSYCLHNFVFTMNLFTLIIVISLFVDVSIIEKIMICFYGVFMPLEATILLYLDSKTFIND
jgi:phosphatidylglycerophosphate synthase